MRAAAARVSLAALLSFLAAPVLAHGDHPTGRPQGAKRPSSLSILSQAQAAARIEIDRAAGYRYIRADGLPDHATGAFPGPGNPHAIARQNLTLRVALTPRKTGMRASRIQPWGIALNGVLFDPGTAEFWNNDPRSGWVMEAIGGPRNLGLDTNNAHVQPDGTYHYHGIPAGLMARLAKRDAPTLLGYAADGFPIYGPFGYANAADTASGIKKLSPSWRLRPGPRAAGEPPGNYNGHYTRDFEFAAGTGDLDECNGREGPTPEYPDGTYHYVLTESFPFIPRCFRGEPDASFNIKGPPQGSGPGGGRGGPPPGGGPGGRPPPR
ncbi:MAG: YHYH protein [Proteobacteria bacterium]|nr:YHYH protein [Pseudomonadota bacterium]